MKTIPKAIALATLLSELVYTRARLLADPITEGLSGPIEALMTRCAQIAQEQQALWDRSLTAQALNDQVDDILDDFVFTLDAQLRFILQKERDVQSSSRYQLYFKQSPREIRRLALQSQLPAMSGFVASLKGEPETALKDLATELETILKRGEKVLVEQAIIDQERNVHRSRTIEPFIDEVNSARSQLLAALIQLADGHQKPRDWQERFFKKENRKEIIKEKQ